MAGSPTAVSGIFAGRYAIEREIGRGATATVFLAHDRQRGRGVAIKVLRDDVAQNVGAERFLREIRITQNLQHPHVVPVLDSGEADGQLYCVLPHMEEGSLRQLLQREKQLPVDRAIAIVQSVAEALDHAHSKGLIHRDVKPENILFTSGQACLADFGIARAIERAIDESTTSTGLVRGTPAYMSPEQASGSTDYDGRSDIYSLALVFYEMLAGVPAFIAPTPEAVIAQRFLHAPRPLSVYRPQVPPALEVALDRALSLTAADRFQSASEFVRAVDEAWRSRATTTHEGKGISGIPRFMRSWPALLVGAVVLTSFPVTYLLTRPGGWTGVIPDSARVAVFPFAGTAGDAALHEQLHAALRRWQPLEPVSLEEVRARVRGEDGAALSIADASDLARALKARRYVIGRVHASATGRYVTTEYRDILDGLLYASRTDLPATMDSAAAAMAMLADSLVLRGASLGGASLPSRPHLYATQHLLAGFRARDEWNLAGAESLFARATELNPLEARGFLWVAQVRSWRGLATDQWATAAERALQASASLPPVEQLMARALVALGARDAFAACDSYRAIIAADPRSFTGWYGLGECQRLDRLVVPDRRSVSGWRFRSSYQQELNAYIRAFELLPAIHRGFEAGGYSRLRELLITDSRTLRQGMTAGAQRQVFLARPALQADTLVLVPFEVRYITSGDRRAAASREAITRSREIFHQVVTRWAAAYPRSAEAKEAVSISLELQGDRRAVDTLSAALAIAAAPLQRLRYAVWLSIMRVKFGAPDSLDVLRATAGTIDSLLDGNPSPSHEVARLLAPLAALRGRCRLTQDLLTGSGEEWRLSGVAVTGQLMGRAAALHTGVLLGCDPPGTWAHPDSMARQLPHVDDPELQRQIEYQLLGRSVAATFPLDSAWVTRLAAVGDYVLEAEAAALRRDLPAARRILLRAAENRTALLPGTFTADAAIPEARLWLFLGDSAQARRTLDAVLRDLPWTTPVQPRGAGINAAEMAGLMGAMAMRARLRTADDDSLAARWQRASAILLDGSGAPPVRARPH